MSHSIKHHSELDLEKWDQLVQRSSNGSIFSTSHYLNATCDNWYAYIDESYSSGMAFGVTTTLGVQSIFPPYFHRYSELLSIDRIDKDGLATKLLAIYRTGVVHIDQEIPLNCKKEPFVYQTIDADNYKLKSQAKRMLNKFNQQNYQLIKDNSIIEDVLALIKSELSAKMDLYSSNSVKALDRIVSELPDSIQLITLGLQQDDKLLGGLIGLRYKNTLLYLKGTSTEQAKNHGGMYALMDHLIHEAIDNDLHFDFGGSRVEGVRFFNRRFNAQDKTYFCYQWNKAPQWYKLLKQINQWRKK